MKISTRSVLAQKTLARMPGTPALRRWLPLVLGAILTLICLALLLQGAEPEALQLAISRARPDLLALAFALSTGTIVLKALRWRALYPPESRPSRRIALLGSGAAIALNWLIPARLGEALKVGLATADVRARLGVTRGAGQSLGVLVVEKALDGSALVLAVGLAVLLGGLPEWLNQLGLLLIASFATIAVVVLLVARCGRNEALDLVDRMALLISPALHSRLRPVVTALFEGLTAITQTGAGLTATLATLFSWGLGLGANWAVGSSLGLDFGVYPALAVLIALYGGAVLPSLPTRLGVFQYLCVLALSPFGAGFGAALAYSLVLYAVVYLPPALIGLLAALLLQRTRVQKAQAQKAQAQKAHFAAAFKVDTRASLTDTSTEGRLAVEAIASARTNDRRECP